MLQITLSKQSKPEIYANQANYFLLIIKELIFGSVTGARLLKSWPV
jgi:hypothetical protein